MEAGEAEFYSNTKNEGSKKVRVDCIEEATRKTRKLLSLSGLVNTYTWHLQYTVYVISNALLAVSLLAYSLYYYRQQIDKVAVIVHHAILFLDVCAAPTIGFVWKDKSINLLNETYWSYNYQSSIMLAKLSQVKKESGQYLNKTYKYSMISMLYMYVDFVLIVASERFLNNEPLPLIFPCWFPFRVDAYTTYIAANLWEFLIVTHMGFMVFGSLLLILCFYRHMKTELELLKYGINHIEERAYEMNRFYNEPKDGERESDQKILKSCYIKCTRMCAEHHSIIIRYYQDGAIVTEIIYLLVFITGLVICTCTGFALISDNTALKVKFSGITVIELIYLYIMCWAAEIIAEESLSVGDTVYSMDWYNLPKECQSILKIMMVRCNKPILMKTLTGQKVNLEGYMSLIKASYSYFNMMLATTQ